MNTVLRRVFWTSSFSMLLVGLFFSGASFAQAGDQGYGTGQCAKAAALQFGITTSDLAWSECYSDEPSCGTAAGTVITANGCNQGDVCCAKPNIAGGSCLEYAKKLYGADGVKGANCTTNPNCGTGVVNIGSSPSCTGGSNHCCAVLNFSNIPSCGEAVAQKLGSVTVTKAQCFPNAEKCAKEGFRLFTGGGTQCTPGVCCYSSAGKALTCDAYVKQVRGANASGVCGDWTCPKGYDDMTTGQTIGNISDCTEPKICCATAVKNIPTAKGAAPSLQDPLSGASFFNVINRVIKVFLGVAGALAFAVFIYAGVMWMTAGSSDRVNTAKAAIKYAVIGLVLIGLSFAITNFIIDALVAGAPSNQTSTTPSVEPATPQQLQP